jgi:hypothetical protein
MKEIKFFLKSPFFFISMATAAKFDLPIAAFFLAYLIQLDVDVTGNITAKLQNFVKLEVNLTYFAPWLPWQRQPF